jgi:hypothetical protein
MANEFRFENAATYASLCGIAVAMPSNAVWDGSAWTPLAGISAATAAAGVCAGTKEATSDSVQLFGAYLFSLPNTNYPAGTVTVRMEVFTGITPVAANWLGTTDFWVALPVAGGGTITIYSQGVAINETP